MSQARKPIPPARKRDEAAFTASFDPVPTRARHDGWTPERQVDFIEALAASACVEHAAKAVGMSTPAAYKLRARADAQSFRAAWDFALEYAVSRLADATLARAIHGVARPVFYQGEQIGERRYYDERLAMFILRTRDPVRYGAWIDGMIPRRHPEAAAIGLARAANRLADDAWADAFDDPRPRAAQVFPIRRYLSSDDQDAAHDQEIESLHDEVRRFQAMMFEAEERADAAEDALAKARGEGKSGGTYR